jgi:addiction module HigA family antidote
MSYKVIDGMPPTHPGEILLEEFMIPLELSANRLAGILGVPANRVSAIVAGKRGISADTALRLERAFGASAEFWLNLQRNYDLKLAKRNASGLGKIKRVAA